MGGIVLLFQSRVGVSQELDHLATWLAFFGPLQDSHGVKGSGFSVSVKV